MSRAAAEEREILRLFCPGQAGFLDHIQTESDDLPPKPGYETDLAKAKGTQCQWERIRVRYEDTNGFRFQNVETKQYLGIDGRTKQAVMLQKASDDHTIWVLIPQLEGMVALKNLRHNLYLGAFATGRVDPVKRVANDTDRWQLVPIQMRKPADD